MKIHREKRVHTRRGRILRVTASGPGLLMVEGQQYAFRPDETWPSDLPPVPGQVVDVEFDHDGNVTGVAGVSASQLLRERTSFPPSRQQNIIVETGVFALATVTPTVVMLAAWFFLTAVSIQASVAGNLELTTWDVLALLNRSHDIASLGPQNSDGAGWYGLAGIVALAGPLLPFAWKNRIAQLGGLLPLLFLIIVSIIFRGRLETAIAGDARTISLGPGAYVSAAAGLWLAFVSVRRFLTFNKTGEEKPATTHQKAA